MTTFMLAILEDIPGDLHPQPRLAWPLEDVSVELALSSIERAQVESAGIGPGRVAGKGLESTYLRTSKVIGSTCRIGYKRTCNSCWHPLPLNE